MPLFSPKKKQDKRKATGPPGGREKPGKRQEMSSKSGGTTFDGGSAAIVVATKWEKPSPTPSLPSNTEEFEKVVSDVSLEEEKQDNAGAGISYASKAKKPKLDYPFALYVCAGSEERANLTKPHYCAFEDNVVKARIKLSNAEENNQLKIDFMLYCGNSYGLVACANKTTAKWVQSLASIFEFEGKKTRAYARWEQEETWIYSLFLTGEFWKNQKPNYCLGLILKNNNIIGNFRNATVNKASNKNGIFLSFEPIGDNFIKDLNSRVRLDCLICSSLVQKRLRKPKSEEEFLKSLDKRK